MRVGTLTKDTIEVFTDGACSPNPGRGGWGAIVRERGVERELSGADSTTTNNKMEMMAAIVALESLDAGSRVVLYTDSKYVRDGITSWLAGWKRRNWRTAEGKPVKNADLWRRLDAVARQHAIRWVWVRGHSGHPENERADQLAVEARLARRGSSAETVSERLPDRDAEIAQLRSAQREEMYQDHSRTIDRPPLRFRTKVKR